MLEKGKLLLRRGTRGTWAHVARGGRWCSGSSHWGPGPKREARVQGRLPRANQKPGASCGLEALAGAYLPADAAVGAPVVGSLKGTGPDMVGYLDASTMDTGRCTRHRRRIPWINCRAPSTVQSGTCSEVPVEVPYVQLATCTTRWLLVVPRGFLSYFNPSMIVLEAPYSCERSAPGSVAQEPWPIQWPLAAFRHSVHHGILPDHKRLPVLGGVAYHYMLPLLAEPSHHQTLSTAFPTGWGLPNTA